MDWREACDKISAFQDFKSEASWSQEYATIPLGDGTTPIVLMGLGDTHIGAYGANYKLFKEISEEIIATPNLYMKARMFETTNDEFEDDTAAYGFGLSQRDVKGRPSVLRGMPYIRSQSLPEPLKSLLNELPIHVD